MKRKRKLLISIYIGSVRLIYFDLDNTSEIIILTTTTSIYLYYYIYSKRKEIFEYEKRCQELSILNINMYTII